MTTPDDERQVQPLGRYWNEVAAGGPARPADLDHALAETIRRLQAIGAAPTPDPAFAAALWEDLMHQAHAVPLPHPRLVPAPTGGPSASPPARRPLFPSRRFAPGRWWPRLEFVAVALLAVALAGGLTAMNGGLPGRFGSFVARDDDQGEEAPFPLLQGLAEVPPSGEPPVEVVLRRVTLDSGATWETPTGFVAASLESGALIQSTGRSGQDPYRMRAGEGVSGDGETVVFRNDQPEPAILFLAMLGPGVRGPDLPSGVTAEELGGGTADTLPAGPASVTVDRSVLAPGEGEGLDTGRDGLALIVVEDGTLDLNGFARQIELSLVESNQAETTPPSGAATLPEAVPLTAGDTALLQGGAILFLKNDRDERTSALVLTVNPGTAQTQIISGESESVVESVYGPPTRGEAAPPEVGSAATPSADADVVAADECDVAPRTTASLQALVGARPETTPAVDGGSFARDEDALPEGTPLDAATLAEITEVEREYVACLNAGDWPRNLALVTDATARDLLGGEATAAELLAVPSPEPLLPDERIGLFPLRDARRLPDGRVAAIVDWGQVGFENRPRQVTESNVRVYERVDGRWLIAGEISTGGKPAYR